MSRQDLLVQRQGYPGLQASALPRACPNTASLSLHQALAHSQTQAYACRLTRSAVRTIKAFENCLCLLRGDARPSVQYNDFRLATFYASLDLDRTIGWAVLV